MGGGPSAGRALRGAAARGAPYTEELGADPGRLRIGLCTTPPGGQFDAHPECVSAAETTARLLESLGHAVEPSYPEVLNDENYMPSFLVRWSAGVDWNLRYWSDKHGQDDRPGRRRGADVGAGRDGPRHNAANTCAPWSTTSRDAQGRGVVGRGLRPPAHAHDGVAAAAARLVHPRSREPADADRDRHSVRDLHGGLQHHRPARDLAPAPRAWRACRSGSSWWPPTGARTCCCAWPRSWRRPPVGRARAAGVRRRGGGLAASPREPCRPRATGRPRGVRCPREGRPAATG